MIPDQKLIWDKKHSLDEHGYMRTEEPVFTVNTEKLLKNNSVVLEIGCGVGGSAALFAKKGHKVYATDLSSVVTEQNRKYYQGLNIDFITHDICDGLAFDDGSFDMVFAHLSLHYFTHDKTKEIIRDVARVLKPGGVFALACKSVNDSRYAQGEKIEHDVFVSSKNHVRHFFSVDYVAGLLGEMFEIELNEEKSETYSDEGSTIVYCIARKKKEANR